MPDAHFNQGRLMPISYPTAPRGHALNRAWQAVSEFAVKLLHSAQPYPQDEELAGQLRATQLRKVASLSQATLPAQMVCSLSLAWMLFDLNPLYCVLWPVALLMVSLLATWRIRRNMTLATATRRNLAVGTAVILTAACLWGSLPIVMLNVAWEAEDIPIVLAMVGIAAGGCVTFQSIPLAAAGWVLILSSSVVVGMWMDGFIHMTSILGGAILLVSVLLRNIWRTSAHAFSSQRLVNQANQLAQSLSQHALIVESTSNGVLLLDAARKITWVNKGFALQSGYELADAIGRSPEEWLAVSDKAETLSMLVKRLSEKSQAQTEVRYRHRDGRWVWAHVDVKRLQGTGDGRSRYVLVATDITNMKRAEHALRREQERQKHIIDGTHCGTWEMDIDGGVCMVGGHWFDIIGVDTIQPFVAEGDFILGRIHPDDVEGRRKALRRYIQGLTPQFSHEYRLRHEDGSWRWVSVRGKASAHDEQGRITQMSGIAMDISQRKSTDKALIEATRQAKQANQAKSLFLATMSHEIRTPMNGVIGTAEWLKVTQLDEEQRDGIQTIVDSGRALLTIIDDILDFTKIEAGRMKLEESALSLLELAEGVFDAITPVAAAKHVDLHVFVDPKLPAQVLGDATRLRQVLFNLVGNAVKFGAGTEGRQGQVDVQVVASENDESTWQMQISDDGIGMSAETLRRLFTPFTQAEAATTRRFGGTGLGLAICHRLVELMGGGIEAHSVPGHGATFIVTLPLAAPDEVTFNPLNEVNLQGVDCVLLNGKSYRGDNFAAYLTHAGANVQVCQTEAEAREVSTHWPALVLVSDTPPEADQQAAFTTARADWAAHVRHLWVGQHRRGALRIVAPHVGQLGRAHARDFLRAVAVLSGRLSPEVDRNESSEFNQFGVDLASASHERQSQKRLILIAEDDPTNQKVVKRQLKILGYACEVADNGQAALELWRTNRFDILLSDLHMPELDGYELAQKIRAEEAEGHLPRLPILALTANALAGEEVRARECGMDDYLTKPIALEGLHAALKRWLSVSEPSVSSVQAPVVSARDVPRSDCLDVNVLRRLVGDDEDIVQELLQDFAASSQQIGVSMRDAQHAQAAERMRQLSHQLKSAARSVGALRLGQLCEACEAACAQPGQPSSEPLNEVLQELQAVQHQLDNLLQERTS